MTSSVLFLGSPGPVGSPYLTWANAHDCNPADYEAIVVDCTSLVSHVRSQAEGGIDSGLEGGGEASGSLEVYDVVGSMLGGDFRRAVGGAVVDEQDFDLVHSVDAPRNLGEGHGKRVGFVQARDLDD